EEVALDDVHVGPPPDVAEGAVDRWAEIDRDDLGPGLRCPVAVASVAAAGVERDLAGEIAGGEQRLGEEGLALDVGRPVTVGPAVAAPLGPLEAEVLDGLLLQRREAVVGAVGEETRDAADHRVGAAAGASELALEDVAVTLLGRRERELAAARRARDQVEEAA